MIINCTVDDALDHLNQAEYGAHYMIIYPDLMTSRELYYSYVYMHIEDDNEIVLVNPFYETKDSVNNDGMKGRKGLPVLADLGAKKIRYSDERILLASSKRF